MAKPSATNITKMIKSGIPRRLAILIEYGNKGKLSKKYKGVQLSNLKRKGK
jgi:hypothetical protein